jgi:4-amino-4-deoxy-L-arabinose transferase-like glycosyltransferase
MHIYLMLMGNKKRLGLLITGIFLLAATLRLSYLTRLPVFADEAIYIRWAQVMRAESTLRFLPLSDGKQPLFMWTVMPALKFITDPLLAGRVVSAICGLFTTLGIGLASYFLFDRLLLAVTSALIWAVLPYSVFFDRLALADGMLTMFVVWGFTLSLYTFKHLRWDVSMLAGFALGFAWLTKSPAMFSLAFLPSLWLLFSPKTSRRQQLLGLGLLLTIWIIAFFMYNILRLGPEFHLIAMRNQDYVFPLSEVIRHPTDPLFPHLKDSFSFLVYFLTPLGLLFAILGIFEGGLKHWRQRLILILWAVVPIFTQSFIAKAFTARYLLFTIPFLVVLAVHGLWHFGDRTQKHILSFLGLLLLVGTSLLFDFGLIFSPQSIPLPRIERSGYLEEWTAGYGIREVASYLKTLTGPVVVGSEGFFGTPFSALEMYLNTQTNVRVVGVNPEVTTIDKKLTNAKNDNQVFLVVNSTRLHALPDNLNLELLAHFPKAIRPDGSRESLLFFKLK